MLRMIQLYQKLKEIEIKKFGSLFPSKAHYLCLDSLAPPS